MGLKAAVQALKKAEPLRDKVQRCKDLLNDNDAWLCQRQLQKIYQQVLILDLEYALDRKVEQELWNLGFKNYIATLQSQAKDRRNPKRSESQALLSWCLEAASGFYLTLLQEICTAFDLDLPFRRKGYIYGCISPWKAVEKLSAPHKSSCFYMCQYCLVHLGDIARYRNQNKQAELFYRHAVSLSPFSGQPYNQLALLEASRGDKLSTVFHYVRSVAVKHPFPVASANLAKTLSSALNDTSFKVEGKTKLSSQEFMAVFLKLHGIVFDLGNLSSAASYVKLLNETLTALVATESFSSWRLVQMLIINLYSLQHTAGEANDNTKLMNFEQLSSEEKLSRNCILDLIAGNLSALLLPVYTIKNAIFNYFALPSIKLCLDWIQIRPEILEDAAFTSRLQIWPSLCVLLNGLRNCITDFDYDKYAKIPLPEDRDLQGFLPLEKCFQSLDFTSINLDCDTAMFSKVRAKRILILGQQLTQHMINGAALINLDNSGETFIAATEGSGVSNELMKELEELSLNKDKQPLMANSPVPSETASSKGSSEIDSLITEFNLEKRGGILKPQGSLERNRDTGGELTPTSGMTKPNSSVSGRKPRQNVAMQAIMRRAETEQKQVTFKNLSPVEDNKAQSCSSDLSIKNNNDKTIQQPSIAMNGSVTNNVAAVQPHTSSTTNDSSVITKNIRLGVQKKQQMQQQQQSQPHMLPQPKLQLQSEQQIKLDKNVLNLTHLPQQQPQSQQLPTQQFQQSFQCENAILPSAYHSQYPLMDHVPQPQLQIAPSTTSLNQYSQQALQNLLTAFPNQSFNVQGQQQFNKNMMLNPSQLQPPYPPQFNQSQTTHPVPYPAGINIQNQNRLIQQQQNSFGGIGQSNPLSNQPLNLAPSNQTLQSTPQQQPHQPSLGQNISLTLHQPSLGVHSQNLMTGAHLLNGLNLKNHLCIPAQSNIPYQDASVPNSANFTSFNPNNFNPKQGPPNNYVNNQQFVYQSPNKNPPSQNNFPMYQSYDAKDFSPWKESQPPVSWWNSNNGPLSQGINKDLPVIPGIEAFHNWATSSASQAGQHMNNMPVTQGNNFSQGRAYSGRNNYEDMRKFDLEQKQQQQSPAASNTYSLFSGNSWGVNGQISSNLPSNQQDQMKARLNQQSLWSGPGPSPLERLLEQQKSLREGGT